MDTLGEVSHTIEAAVEATMMIIERKIPGIQAYYVPLKDFDKLVLDEAFRKNFWNKQLESPNIRKNTILEPIFDGREKVIKTIHWVRFLGVLHLSK